MQQNNLDKAAEELTRALKLHTQAHDTIGQVNNLHGLGYLYMQQDNHEKQ